MKKISIVSVLIKKKLKKYKSIPLIATMVIFTLFLTSSLVFAEDSLSSNSEQITEKSDSNSSKQEQTNQSITPSLSETKESSENPKIESYNSLNKTPFGISNGHYFNYLPDLYKYNGLVINTPAYFEGEWPPYNSIYTGEYGIDYFDGSNGDLGTDWQYQYAQIAGVGSKFLLPEAVKMMYRTMPYQVSADMSKFLGYQPSGFVYRQKLDLNRKQVMGFYYRSSLDGPGFTATLHNDTDFSPSNVNELSDPLKATIFGPIGGGGFGFGAYPLTHEERAFATKTSGTNQLRLWGLNDWNGGNSGKKYETQFIENAISIELDFVGGKGTLDIGNYGQPTASAYNQYIYSSAPSKNSGHMAMIKPEQFKNGIITNTDPQSNAYHNYFSTDEGEPVSPVWDKLVSNGSEGQLKGGRAWRYMEVTWTPVVHDSDPSATVKEGDLSATVYALDSDFNRSGINPQLGAASGVSTIRYLDVDRSPKGIITRFEKPARINIEKEFHTPDNQVFFEVTASTGVSGFGKGSVNQSLLPTIIAGRGTNNVNDEPKTTVKKTADPDKISYNDDQPPAELAKKTSKFTIEFTNDAVDNKKITQFNITDRLSEITDRPFEYLPYDPNNKTSGTTIKILKANGEVKTGFPLSGFATEQFWKMSSSESSKDTFEWPAYKGGEKGFPYPLNPGEKVVVEFYVKSVYVFKAEDDDQLIKTNEAQIDFDTNYPGVSGLGNTKFTTAEINLIKEVKSDYPIFLRQVVRTDTSKTKAPLVKETLPIPSSGYAQISANKNAFLFSIPIVSYNYNLTGTSFGNQYGLPKRFTKVTIPNQVGSNSLSINELSVKAIEQPMYYRYVGMKIEDNLPNPEGTTSENQSIQPDLVDTMWTGDNTNPKYITFIYEPINPTSADFEKPFSGALKVNQIGKVD